MSNFAKPLVKQRVQSIRSDALIFDMELILRKEIARNNGCARRAIFFLADFFRVGKYLIILMVCTRATVICGNAYAIALYV